MFTPPPSPLPIPSSPSISPIDVKLQNSEITISSPKSPTFAELGPSSRIANESSKKRIGKQTLLAVTLLPALFIAFTLWNHHCLPIPRLHNAFQIRPSLQPPPRLQPQPQPPTPTPTPNPQSPSFPTVPNPPVLTGLLPQPFDQTLSNNFSTNGCQNFFTSFLQDANFRQCRAFSFLLNSSSGFIKAQSNITSFNEILGATCNTPPTFQTCDQRMNDFLNQLNQNCSQDISLRNPTVLQAQISFQSYTAMRLASCLQDPAVNAYCYIEALSEGKEFGDIYLYGIPLGTPVPTGVNLSCSSCSQTVLSVFSQFVNPMGTTVLNIGSTTSGNSTVSSIVPSSLPILSMTYPSAAHLAVMECGGKFANVGITQNGAHHRPRGLVLNIPIILLGLISLWIV
ncbi:hypothetical protein Clacol_009190 [Clathrus columnatus]|uniref:DUF7729 domain-containing protein n=1 Tax=Clathrus columnatus TaxID=1419009 RepID=A0AAV5ASP8_9AGAM|nr:hypothetical protein Clacol_009190 [Clathrus columnatus]